GAPAQPGQAGGRRPRGRRQGAGRAHGADAARHRSAAAAGRRRRCRGAGAVPPGPRPAQGAGGGRRGGRRGTAGGGPVIGSLRGRLLHRGADRVLVEVGGVGYEVVTSPTTAASLGEPGDEVFVWIHHHVREDAQVLYGFATRDEKTTFEALLGAHGVGPALALAILSVHGPPALARILAEEDVAALCLVPGVGKKTAARLLIELRSRLDVPDSVAVGSGAAGSPGGNGAAAPGGALADVREALVGLGYTPEEIRTALADLTDDGDASDMLRRALRR